MMYISPLTIDICSVLDEQLADLSVAFLPSPHERSSGVLSKLMITYMCITDIQKSLGAQVIQHCAYKSNHAYYGN